MKTHTLYTTPSITGSTSSGDMTKMLTFVAPLNDCASLGYTK